MSTDPRTGLQIRIGVMGSAEPVDPGLAERCRRLGQAVAGRRCCLLTGACHGLPHQVVLGAKAGGGHVSGISPALRFKPPVETFTSPFSEYDVLIFTGLGLLGRELVNIHSSDIVVVVGGRSGTLGEFAIAYEQGKLIGALSGTGGISDATPALEAALAKRIGAEVFSDSDPGRLIDQLLTRSQSPEYLCPCHPAGLAEMPT